METTHVTGEGRLLRLGTQAHEILHNYKYTWEIYALWNAVFYGPNQP